VQRENQSTLRKNGNIISIDAIIDVHVFFRSGKYCNNKYIRNTNFDVFDNISDAIILILCGTGHL